MFVLKRNIILINAEHACILFILLILLYLLLELIENSLPKLDIS